MLNTSLQNLIKKTTDSSLLSPEEKHEIERELQSHFWEKQRDLQLLGNNEEETDAMISQSFGNPEAVGKEFFLVHRRLERIPWIGPLFYYRPLKIAVKIIFLNILFFLLSLLTMLIYFGEKNNLTVLPFIVREVVIGFLFCIAVLLHPYVIAFFTGVSFVVKKIPLKDIIEIIFLLYIPFIFIILFFLFNAQTCTSYICLRFDFLFHGNPKILIPVLILFMHAVCILSGVLFCNCMNGIKTFIAKRKYHG